MADNQATETINAGAIDINADTGTNESPASAGSMETEYHGQFMPFVHNWGRLTMIIGCFMSFLPVLYLYFFAGFRADPSYYAQVFIAVFAYGFSMWLTEPLSYYPILGSAGTYMGYFAGNVGNMRAPVAMAIQSTVKEDATSPKGNIATIIAVATSVFVNLVILAMIVIAGSTILAVLPQAVISAFSYTLPSLYASMLMMRIMANPKRAFSYLPATAVIFLICFNIPAIKKYSLACCVAGTVLWAYMLFKMQQSKAAAEQK